MAGFSQVSPIISKLRSGVLGDDYVNISLEPHVVVNSRILLSEIPYKLNRVTITDDLETIYTETDSTSPTSNQFHVRYTGNASSIVTFNADKEGRTVYASFSGMGLEYIPVERVYVSHDNNGNITQLLSDLTEGVSNFIDKGTYNPATTYESYNIVTYLGSAYMCKLQSSNNDPTNNAYWTRISGYSWKGTYSTLTTYFSGDTVVNSDNTILYQSKTDNNLNNALSDTDNWQKLIDIDSAITSIENAEGLRVTAENTRQSQESTRQSNESTREGNESTRQSQEIAREAHKDSWVYLGDYNPLTDYIVNNQVSLNGTTYICIQNSTGNEPINTDYWSILAEGTGKVISLRNTVVLGSDTSNVAIGIADFNDDTDILSVYQNSVYIEVNDSYTVAVDGISIDKVSGNWSSGTVINFVVLKNIKTNIVQVDNAQLIDGNITDSKLHSNNKVGSLSTLVTTDKSSAVSAINEISGDVDDLAGAGRTTETVKGNADALNAHLADYTTNAIKRDGSVSFTGDQAHGRNKVVQPQIKDYSETVSTNAAATGAVDLDIANGNVFDVTLTGNTTFTFSNPAPTGQACSFTLIVRQGGTSRTVTWPASVKWSNDVIPDISDINKTSVLTFMTVDGGTRWYGFLAANKLVT